MSHRAIVLLFIALLASSTGGLPAQHAGDGRPDSLEAQVTELADDYWEGWVERNPEFATLQNIPGARHDRLSDNSLEALRAWREREDAWYQRLAGIDPARLSSRARVLYAYLRETLVAARQSRICRKELWSLNQIVGWHVGLPVIARSQPVGTEEARRAALARWRSLPAFIDTEIANLREGMRLGFVQARQPVTRIIEQVDNLLAAEPTESPFFDPARRDTTASFQVELERIIAEGIHPSLRRYRDFLEDEYLGGVRELPGVGANPDGAACYRALVRSFTTLDLDPGELHRLGLREVDAVAAERERLAKGHGVDDIDKYMQAVQQAPENRFESRQEIIDYSEGLIERARVAASGWFDLMPRGKVIVESFPEFQERSSPGGLYFPGTPDGGRPGTFRINTYQPQTKSKIGLETLVYHEAIPGHHFQLTLANEREDAHPITRYLINSGFAEGWALYAERLADEMGLFSSDAQRIAMLNGQLGRAARAVLDPGIHVLGWSRERALSYFSAMFDAPPEAFEVEVDRYIAWPGQAPSYLLGMLEIRRLRELAEAELGDEFDIETFHTLVLEDGSVPLPFLRAKVEGWIASVDR